MHARRIAVDPTGNPWVVTSDHRFVRHAGGRWLPLPGRGVDISIGANGAVWSLGETDSGTVAQSSHGQLERESRGPRSRHAGRLAVVPTGVPWIINDAYKLCGSLMARNGKSSPGRSKKSPLGRRGRYGDWVLRIGVWQAVSRSCVSTG